MTDQQQTDMDAEARRQAELRNMIGKIDYAVEAIFVNAVSFSRLIPMGTDEVPRLCVQAGCRFTEQLVEQYQRRRRKEQETGTVVMSLEEREARKQDITNAVADLERVLEEGLASCRQIQRQLATDAGEIQDADGRPN